MKAPLLSILALLASLLPGAARAGDYFPGEALRVQAAFPSGASAVTVDVHELGGALLADDAVATQETIDGAASAVWTIDLSALAGFPLTCAKKTYVVVFSPDAANCAAAGTPESCVHHEIQIGGSECETNPQVQVSEVFATAPISAQGITQTVRNHWNRRGQEVLRWREFKVAADRDFTTPDHTYWEVYFYSATGAFPHLQCVVETETDPAVTTPSKASCSGS